MKNPPRELQIQTRIPKNPAKELRITDINSESPNFCICILTRKSSVSAIGKSLSENYLLSVMFLAQKVVPKHPRLGVSESAFPSQPQPFPIKTGQRAFKLLSGWRQWAGRGRLQSFTALSPGRARLDLQELNAEVWERTVQRHAAEGLS